MQIHHSQKFKVSQFLLLLSILTIAAACGGGGASSDSSNPNTNVTPNELQVQFSQTVLDHFQDEVVVIQNQGNTSHSIGVVAQSDPIDVPFSITDDQCSGLTLAPSETCALTIQFSPTSQNIFDDTFDIPSDNGLPLMVIGLNGKAVALNASVNQIDKSACPTIRLFVTVTDRNDEPVTSLGRANFLVFENSSLQAIDSFSNTVTTPLSAALVLDSSGSIQSDISNIEAAAKSFIDQLDLNSNSDEAAIFKFAASIELKQPFTYDYDALLSAISDAFTGSIDKTRLYDAVWQAVDNTSDPSRNDRRVVVVLSDGIDEGSIDHDLTEVIEYANENSVPVFSIGLGNVFIPTLQALADKTGGQYFLAPTSNDLQAIYQLIAEILTNQYVIEYQSPSSGGDIIDLDIEVESNGLYGEDSKSVTGC